MNNDSFRNGERVGPCRPVIPGRHAPSPSPQKLTVRTNFPLAYHITFGTYGTRLHGDARGTVDRCANKYGDPIIGRDNEWEHLERQNLKFPPRILTIDQRIFVEQEVPKICQRGGWKFLQIAAAPDHVHNMISANVEGKDIRKWLKRWLGESLCTIWPLQPDQVWWAECGSVKWIWTEDYYDRVQSYVQNQKTVQ